MYIYSNLLINITISASRSEEGKVQEKGDGTPKEDYQQSTTCPCAKCTDHERVAGSHRNQGKKNMESWLRHACLCHERGVQEAKDFDFWNPHPAPEGMAQHLLN